MLQRMQLEEISELLNMLSALVPLAPTLLMKRQIAAIALSLLLVAIDLGTYVKPPLIPVNNQNRDRQLNSFSDEECDRELRFTRVEIQAILTELHLPQSFTMDNGLRVDGESAFLYFLYRMHYPNTLAMGQEMWGREYSELDRIYNFMTDNLFERYSHCVLNDFDWLQTRHDLYNRKTCELYARTAANPNPGTVPGNLCRDFCYMDGTADRICKPSGAILAIFSKI